ncbi:MAG TPA: ABC transporter permease [Thermoanaerobaculia bacterium]|nr:ABC transporter permease [Thermoanaerobaculia bacterium]
MDRTLPEGRNRRTLDREIEDELEFHLEMTARELEASGLGPTRAREEAERRFGDRLRHRARCREIQLRRLRGDRRRSLLRDLRVDLAYGVRELVRSPGLALLSIGTLAVAIGASTLIFSLVSGILLEPLPLPDPDRLVVLWESERETGDLTSVSPANFVDWREQAGDTFSAMAAYDWKRHALTGLGEPVTLTSAAVSRDFFRAAGIEPRVGRAFTAEELVPGGPAAAIVSDGFWRTRLGAEPDVLGRTLELDGAPARVVGVMPPGFAFPSDVDLWTPLLFDFDLERSRGAHYLQVVARLAPGIEESAAAARMDQIGAALEAAHPANNEGKSVRVLALHEDVVESARRTLGILFAGVTLVLLIAILDVAGLQLVRGWARRRELAVRGALGATAGRITRQLVTESLLIAALGGALGVVLAALALPAFLSLLPSDVPRLAEVSIDGRVLLFALAAVALAGLFSGLWPALRVSRHPVADTLREAGDARARAVARGLLVVGEVAIAVVLVAASALLLRSFARILDVDPGFDARSKLTFRVDLPEHGYPDSEAHPAVFQRLQEGLEALPGVRSVAMSPWLPLDPGWVFSFTVVGEPEPEPNRQPLASLRFVNDGYFSTLGIRLLDGRTFTPADRAGAENVLVINETLARRHFADGSPIGRKLVVGYGNPTGGKIERTVIGVVGDVRQYRLTRGAMPAIYVPHLQVPFDTMSFALATNSDPLALARSAREVVHGVDASLVVDRVEPMADRLARSVGPQRFALRLFGAFALLALLLALLGLYGLLAHTVIQEQREIGLRLALGAERPRVAGRFLLRGVGLAGGGVACGLIGAALLARLLESMLYETSTHDLAAFAAAPLLVLLAAALASWLPALRATRVDPVRVLRAQ